MGIILVFAFIIIAALFYTLYVALSEQKRNRKKLAAQADELQHQQTLLEGNLRVQEEERQKIAAQLHDDVCSKLGVLHLSFHRLRRTGPDSEQYTEMCEEINDLIGETLGITRRISHELVPPTLEGFGLVEAIEELCEQIRNTGEVDIRFQHNINRDELGDVSTELNLFRIVQELTNNSLKHAEASFVSIELLKDEGFINLNYLDNGVGFDPKNANAKGLGLKNIFNRAKMVGATTEMSTAPNQGFEIRFAMSAASA